MIRSNAVRSAVTATAELLVTNTAVFYKSVVRVPLICVFAYQRACGQ